MRILFTRFPLVSAAGGAENQTMWLTEELKSRGHHVRFLGSCHELLKRFHTAHLPVAKLVIGPPPVSLWTAISFLWRKDAMQKKLIAAVEALPEKPEAIIMLSLTEKILLTEWAVKKGMKVLWVEHDRIGRWLTKNPWLGALKRASAFATIVCVSQLSKKMYVDLGFPEKRIVAIPNGVPRPSGENVSGVEWKTLAKVGNDVKTLHIGCIARLSPEKGIDVLIQSLTSLPEINLTVVGVGKEEGYLKSLMFEDSQRVGMQRMKLVTHIKDLEKFYASLDIFVLPSSEHDPFGLVAAEAMARGVATIITDMCGIAGSLENGKDALIVQAGSAASLESAVKILLDPVVRTKIALEGALTARTCFGISAMTDSYEQVLQTS